MMKRILSAAGLAAVALPPAPVQARPPVTQAVQVGNETVRYLQGVPTLDLHKARGAVQITPLPMDHGSLVFSIAVLNTGDAPATIDVTNVSARSAGKVVGVFSVQELLRKARNRAMWGQIGLAFAGGLSAAAAASQRDVYRSTLVTPHGFYSGTYSAPSALGQVQAMAIAAGTGVGIAAIQSRLDRTRAELGNEVVQLTTVDPDTSYAGRIVLNKLPSGQLPQRVDLTVKWNDDDYPFAFQLAREGTPTPMFAVAEKAEATGETQSPQGDPAGQNEPTPSAWAVPPAGHRR